MARERHDAKISATGKGKPWNRLSYDYRKQLYYKEVATYEKQHGKGSAFRPVSGNTSYAEYLAKQPEDFRREVLGPIRAKLFDGGKLQLKDMVSLDTGYERSVSFLEDLVEGRTTVAGKSQEAPGTLPDIRSAEKFTEVFGGVNEKFQKRIDDITAERNESLKSYDDQLASATTKARHDAILKRRTEELNRFQSEIGEVKKERAHEAISMLFPINDAYSENRGNLRSAALKDGRKDVIDAADMMGRILDNSRHKITWNSLPAIVKSHKKRSEFIPSGPGRIEVSRRSSWSFRSALHEMGHWWDHASPELKKEVKAFFDEITAGGQSKRLGRGYKKNERFVPASIPMPLNYCTKIYSDGMTEMTSVFLQCLVDDPFGLASKYPTFFNRMMEILK